MIKAAIKVGLWVVLFALALGFMAGRAGATSSESDPYPEPPVEECPIADAIAAGWTPGGDIPCGHGPQNDDTPSTTVPEDPDPEPEPPVTPEEPQEPVQDIGEPATIVRPPAELALTGSTTTGLVLAGALLLVVGLGFLHGEMVVRNVRKWWDAR